DLAPVVRVDAVVRGTELTLDLCAELERLAPFGLGNPGVTLLTVDCELSELGAVGEGKHLKLAVKQWNGAVSPQFVVKRIFDTRERFEDLRLALVAEWKAGPAEWSEFARG